MNRSSQRDPAKELFWRQAFQDWNPFGLNRKQFCLDRGRSRHAFDSWRSGIAKRDPPPSTSPEVKSRPVRPPPRLMPVRLVVATAREIRLTDGRAVLVPVGFDPNHLRAVLAVLESPPC